DRFVDEASDVRGRTYAKMGRAILAQPGGLAWQLFDVKARQFDLLGDYDRNHATGVKADTLEQLAVEIGVDPRKLAVTVAEYNEAIQPGRLEPSPFALDHKHTQGLAVDKSNYSISLDE